MRLLTVNLRRFIRVAHTEPPTQRGGTPPPCGQIRPLGSGPHSHGARTRTGALPPC